MIKYPSLLTVKEFAELARKVPELLDLEAYVEPKYDGSNITVFDGSFATRNLNPLPPQFEQGLRIALGDRLGALIELSKRYQVFLELGGRRNAPAGYADPWEGEWDYRVLDLYAGRFLAPDRVAEICEGYGLKFVGYTVARVADVLENWWKMLRERYAAFEGFVLKIFPPPEIARRVPHLRHNMIAAKFKHEYLGQRIATSKRRGKEGRESGERGLPPLPESEIMAAINRAHLVLGDDIRDPRKAMPLIFRLAKEEAEKHGCAVPDARTLYRCYRRYLERTS